MSFMEDSSVDDNNKKIDMTMVVTPPTRIMSRASEAFCVSPALNNRGYVLDKTYFNEDSGVVMLDPVWNPANYQWGKDDYSKYPIGNEYWIESNNALGKGDMAIGFAAGPTTPPSTQWTVSTITPIEENRGIVVNLLWFRPTDVYMPTIEIIPRVDMTKEVQINGWAYNFCPIVFSIDSQSKFNVFEYPYDTYDAFEQNPSAMLTRIYSHQLKIDPMDFSSNWISIMILPIDPNSALVLGDVLEGGGFVYRSDLEHKNVAMFPEGPAFVSSRRGGISQVSINPIEVPETGSFKSNVMQKSEEDNEYPIVKVFGWSPFMINDYNGYMENVVIPHDTGVAGISYKVYAVSYDEFGNEIEAEVPIEEPFSFKDFKYEIHLNSYSQNVSPTINDVIVEYSGVEDSVFAAPIDIASDVVSISESMSEEIGSYKADIEIRNDKGLYNYLAERPMNEIDWDIDGEDKAVLFTLDVGYDYMPAPGKPALFLKWKCGDLMEYLKKELVYRHPPYDGMLLSDAVEQFCNRIGLSSDMIEIDETDVRLPKKRGKGNYLFRPEDGTPAIDFIKKMQEWFRSEWIVRATRDGKLQFKDATNIEIARTYYLSHSHKKNDDDFMVYGSPQIELFHEQFYNEIWVVGKDDRSKESIISMYQNKPSQSDPNAPDFVGRRLIMIVLTRLNRQDAIDWVCAELASFYGVLRTQVTFSSKIDVKLAVGDFIQLFGFAKLFRVTRIDNTVNVSTVTSGAINDEKPYIKGASIVAISWPFRRPVAPLPGGE